MVDFLFVQNSHLKAEFVSLCDFFYQKVYKSWILKSSFIAYRFVVCVGFYSTVFGLQNKIVIFMLPDLFFITSFI